MISSPKQLFLIILTMWLASFLSSRGLLFMKEYAIAKKHFKDDIFTLTAICNNNDIKANLGKNAHICEQAQINVEVYPWQTAFQKVVDNTYLCGNTPCLDLFDQATQSFHTITFSLLALCISPYVLYWFLRLCTKKVGNYQDRHKLQVLHQNVLPLQDELYYKRD